MVEGLTQLSLETSRLLLRPLTLEDEPALSEVLGDAETMRWYPHPFSREQVREWIERQISRYATGTGLLGVVEKQSDRLLGDCGACWQDIEGRRELEVGYHVHRLFWGRGFATEAARAVMDSAFTMDGVEGVISMIRPGNIASRRVAEKNGLTLRRMIFWRDYDHCIYQARKN